MTDAAEGMKLTKEEVQMFYTYKNGEISGDELKQKILREVR